MPRTMDAVRAQDPFNAEWVTGLLLLVLGIFAWTNLNAARKWRLWLRNMFRLRLSRQALREDVDIQDRAFLGMLLAATLILALQFHQLWQWLAGASAPRYVSVLLAVALVVLAQALSVRLVALLAGSSRGLAEYGSTGSLIIMLNGVLLLPLVVLSAYQVDLRSVLIPIGGGVVILMLLYRWLRGAWVALGEGIPLRYIILYLCAAEVVPVLLLAQIWLPQAPPKPTP